MAHYRRVKMQHMRMRLSPHVEASMETHRSNITMGVGTIWTSPLIY